MVYTPSKIYPFTIYRSHFIRLAIFKNDVNYSTSFEYNGISVVSTVILKKLGLNKIEIDLLYYMSHVYVL